MNERITICDSAETAQYFCEDLSVKATGKWETLAGDAIRVRARLARTGVQEYAPWPGAPVQDRKIRLYRPAEEVFHPDSLASLRSNPLTLGHPQSGEVTADSWRREAIGHVEGAEVKRVTADDALDGKGEEFVETPIVVSDADAIRKIKARTHGEFSSGYAMRIDWTPGRTEDGTEYDGVMRDIRHNHQALLKFGDARAGRGARIVDARDAGEKQMEEELKALQAEVKALADGLKVATDALAALAKPAEPPKKEEPAKTGDVDESAAKIASLETQVGALTAQLAARPATDAAVSEALALRDSVRGMLPADYVFEGKSGHAIKLDAIKACSPETAKALGEKPSEHLIDGAFLALKGAKTQYVKSTEPYKAPDHVKSYHDRNAAAFADSYN